MSENLRTASARRRYANLRRGRLWVRVAMVSASVISIALWVIWLLTVTPGSWWIVKPVGITLVTLLLGVVSLNIASRIARVEPEIHPSRPSRWTPSAGAVDEIIDLSKRLSDEALDVWRDALLAPKKVFARISESGRPEEGYTSRSATYTVQIVPRDEAFSVLLPLQTFKRGQLVDGLRVTDASAKRVSSVTHDDLQQTIPAYVRRLARRAGSSYETLFAAVIEPMVVEAITLDRRPSKQRFAYAVAALSAIEASAVSRAEALVVTLVVRRLLLQSAIWVRVDVPRSPSAVDPTESGSPQSDKDSITVRYTVEDRVAVTNRRVTIRDGLLDLTKAKLRPVFLVLLGMRDNSIRYPLANASRARSFHFQTDGHSGTFLESHEVTRWPEDSWYELRDPQGQGFSHLYTRGARRTQSSLYIARYFHTPPGPVGLAALGSAVSLIALVVIAVQHLGWTRAEVSTSFALLLGLPAAAIAFLGFEKSSSFLVASVTARLTSLVSFVSVVVAVVVISLFPRPLQFDANQMTADLQTIGVSLRFWVAIVATQATAVLYSTGVWIYRTSLFFTLSRRGESRAGGAELW